MKNIIILLIALWVGQTIKAQNFSFEEPDVPTDWVASAGDVLYISAEHYKDGVQSLAWQTNGNKALVVEFPPFLTSTANGTFMQIYSPAELNDTLIVQYLSGLNQVRRTARYLLNYKGWRDFNRKYNEYAIANSSQDITKVKLILKPTTVGQRTLYFDQVNFNSTIAEKRVIGKQWKMDADYLKGDKTLLMLSAYKKDIDTSLPTAQELEALNTIRIKAKSNLPSYTLSKLIATRNYVDGLQITPNNDGTVKGTPINNQAVALTATALYEIGNRLQILAADYAKNRNNDEIRNRFNNYLNHLLEQGIADGCSFRILSNNYTSSREIPAKFLSIIDVCTDIQKTELLKFVRWFTYYGMLYLPQKNYQASLNSDVVYLYLPHMLIAAAHGPNASNAVQEMRALKRFMDRNTSYTPGGNDLLKTDGTGFHHNSHYNNYMYAYQTWIETADILKGTAFKISVDAYSRMKKAVVALYTMATPGNTDSNRFFALSLAGRNPFNTGNILQLKSTHLEKLIQVGGDCLNTEIDEELAALYNYFYQTKKYPIAEKRQEGFFQFNYSPLAIYRKDNWVVSMRSPTTKFWGAEIYSGANRFGRYQSHGTLEVMYEGNLGASGYPTNHTGGGWDWNMPQGSTTVHYSNWQDLMPNRNTTDRFDQYTKSKNFSGALAWNNCGMFAADFDQIDTWGRQKFIPTNLMFKKSMFAFDGVIISLGSNISSSGTYTSSWTTATNLFQNLVTSGSGTFIINGEAATKPYSATLSGTSDNWMVTPTGTGYFIPKGNDDVVVRFDTQTTPKEDGSDYASPKTSAVAAKAHILHGVKPSDKSYAFVVIPATNKEQMQTAASRMTNNGGKVYKIHTQNSALHAITYLPTQTKAYAFFAPIGGLTFGKVKSSSGALLLMECETANKQKIDFAAAIPNQAPKPSELYGWISTPTTATIALAGEWKAQVPVDGITFSAPANNETFVTIQLTHGEPAYFTAVNYNTAINEQEMPNWFTYAKTNGKLIISFENTTVLHKTISIYSVDGKLLFDRKIPANRQQIEIDLSAWEKGVKICIVSGKDKKNTFKWIE